MYLPIPTQPDCASAWLAAIRAVNAAHDHEASNVIIDVEHPTMDAELSSPIVARVDEFLRDYDKSVETVANTIFPRALYRRFSHPGFIEHFHDRVLPKVRKNGKWSGYYFERMTRLPVVGRNNPIDQLSEIVDRLNDPSNPSLNKYEVSLFDPDRDINGSVYGGQCLSFLSFHVGSTGGRKYLRLTAQYRNQYYVEKLLGNLIGLGRLMEFVALETGLALGPLTIISTHAKVDNPKGSKRSDINELIEECSKLAAPLRIAA